MNNRNRRHGGQLRQVSATVPTAIDLDPQDLEILKRSLRVQPNANSPRETQTIAAPATGYRDAWSHYVASVKAKGYSTRPLDAGAFGSVLLLEKNGLELEEESRLAVKLSNTSLPTAKARKMALQDFNLARYLNWVTHDDPAITRVHQIEDGNAPLFPITMEYVADKTLAHHLKETDLSPTQRLAIAIQVQQLRETMNDAGIIHRDYKPENLFVSFDEKKNPHLTAFDFGIATKVAPTPQKLEEILSREGGDTDTIKWKDFAQRRADYLAVNMDDGMIVGTPAYSAPENIHPTLYLAALGNEVLSLPKVNGAMDAHKKYRQDAEWQDTDKMSVAAMVYEILTGEMLFSELKPQEGDGRRDARVRWMSTFAALNYRLPEEDKIHARWAAKLEEKGYGPLFEPLLQATAVPWQRDDRPLRDELIGLYSSLQKKNSSGGGSNNSSNSWLYGAARIARALNPLNLFANYREGRMDTELFGIQDTHLREDRHLLYRRS